MNISAPFIARPIATTLLAIGVAIAGITAFNLLPVSSLPKMDFPTIIVEASLPGASPEIMATAVATPLERHLGTIAGITDMTSSSNLGSTRIVLQFDLARDINGAARDVQAAINASLDQLPTDLSANPTYRKINPAESSIMVLTLSSDVYPIGKLFEVAYTILQQKLSQVDGMGQVEVEGSSLPAVRIQLYPMILNKYNISLEQVAQAIEQTNANSPKGQLSIGPNSTDIVTNDQLFSVDDYKKLIISYQNGAAVRLGDVARISESVEDVLNAGMSNNKPAIVISLHKQPGTNVIEIVDSVKKMLPMLQALTPPGVELKVVQDRTVTIRASLIGVEITLVVAIILVIGVVFIFLGNARAAIIPSIAVPLSLTGTFGIMYLLGYNLDNLSLIALTIVTGFVVDDAVVVLENISRHIETGMQPVQAALKGAKEIGFTVLSMSISLIAVFIPLLLMGGIVGRLFREFAATLSIAVFMSLLVSLTVTPMMCALLLRKQTEVEAQSTTNKCINYLKRHYARSLNWSLEHHNFILLLTVSTLILSCVMYIMVPKGFFPQQDTGRIRGSLQADQNISFHDLKKKLAEYITIASQDPAIETAAGYVGSGGSGAMFITLKPLAIRKDDADAIIARLRPKLATVAGASLYLQSVQDIVVGGRSGNAQFQYTLSGNNIHDLNSWTPKIMAQLAQLPGIADINSDQLDHGLQAFVQVDRDTAAQLGVSSRDIDRALYNAFGQRKVSTLFTAMNQYHIVMTVADKFWQNPEMLKNIYVPASSGEQVPLASFARFTKSSTLLTVNHQGQFPAVTLSFNLLPNAALGDVVNDVERTMQKMLLPETIQGSFRGNALAFKTSLDSEPYLILAALLAVYVVLGILYESVVHPITILSTLPSAGVGALLSLLLTGTQLTVVALIGILLLIGIVKKNAIMMIDFALQLQRSENMRSREAIYAAAQLRFRPIMMTTTAALFGAIPLVLNHSIGFELRRPLGIAIIGGLVLSQMLTLYTTPVVYLALEKFAEWCRTKWKALLILVASLALSACSLAPEYARPEIAMARQFKEAPAGWKIAQPRDALPKGAWWLVFNDPQLNQLEEKLQLSNQNIAQVLAQYKQALAVIEQTRAAYWPTVVLNASATRTKNSATINNSNGSSTGSSNKNNASQIINNYTLEPTASWSPDLFAAVGMAVDADRFAAAATKAQLANTQLAMQASLAQTYFQLRALDRMQQLLDETVTAYEKALVLTKNRYASGVASRLDIVQADSQLQTAKTQSLDNHILRAQYEHAIAVLVGLPPEKFALQSNTDAQLLVPAIPLEIPSELLERRPDIAQAERLLQQANLQVGVQTAAYFPILTLTAGDGYSSSKYKRLISDPSKIWSLGAALAETIFDGGLRAANIAGARAAYEQSVANYKQVVLAALQNVEDNLVALRILDLEVSTQKAAVASAEQALAITLNQYKSGTVAYAAVITAQTTALQAKQTATTVISRQMVAAVGLIQALGGGWGAF